MRVLYLTLCALVFMGFVDCQFYFVTSPNVIRYEHEETVTVSVFGLVNAQVKVWLQLCDTIFSEKQVVVPNEKTPVNTTLLVTENDLCKHTVNEDKPRTLRMFSEWNGVNQSREVILSYRSGYLIVQTDKSIYTPQQKVRIRTLALKESLKPLLKQEIAMEIISPTNLTMARISIKESQNGFFKHEFVLPPYPDHGIWTARAFIQGQFETSATSQFQVGEYVLPAFVVTADVDVSFIDRTTTSIIVVVRAKYMYGKPVFGTARLTMNLKEPKGTSDFILSLKPDRLQNDGDMAGSVTVFNISTAQIFSSARLQGRAFPDGCKLEVIAKVSESATGVEESSIEDGVMFVEHPYRFHFTRSKLNFRPGWEYALKVDVTYPNGKPVDTIDVNIKMLFNGAEIKDEIKKTDTTGRVIAWFSTSLMYDKLVFKVSTVGESPYSEEFEVTAYKGENQIKVEQKIDSNKLTIQVNTNMHPEDRYTGMIFMVITRGKVVYTSFMDGVNERTEEISEMLHEYITPSARVLVFYVDKRNREVVADSVKFEVEEKCRVEDLTLKTLNKQVKPGDRDQLIVTGSPFMWVGLNVIDKAVLARKDTNILRKHKIVELLASHDLGCGEGSGKSSGDVFKKSGLTVLTNAKLSDDDLTRSSEDCSSIKRRKRDLSRMTSKYLDDDYDYIKDQQKLANYGERPVTRNDFRESWLFDEVQLDNGGKDKQNILYPDSITEWMFQAIGITEDKGMCIAEELDVRAYRPFFIQLHLPYKAVRLEYIDVKATIFSYGLSTDDSRTVNVYIEGVEGICFGSRPNMPSPKVSITLPPNSAQVVSFPMIPTKAGIFPIKVSAMVTEGSLPMVDVVEKKLYVVNEGIEVKIPIQIWLDSNKNMEDCKNDPRVVEDVINYGAEAEQILTVDLSLPEDSISGTGAATGYIQSNVMDNIVTTMLEGVDKLIFFPYGSGESTVAITSHNVYAMMYLKQTKQITMAIEKDGSDKIRYGVNRLITRYRFSDGSYSCCSTIPASTWMTAFVAKVFCQAKSVVDDAFNTIEGIEVTINWLANHLKSDGSFVENMPVRYTSLMAVNNTIQKTMTYLEKIDRNVLRNDPYLLAMTTYALAMANSEKKWEFKKLLEEVANKQDKYMYWENAGPKRSDLVETAAYALLGMLQLNDLSTSARIVRWLTAQKNATVNFRSTQDIVVGLQALSAYSKFINSPDVILEVNLLGGGKLYQFSITKDSASVLRIAKNLPVERRDNKLIVRVKGSSAARMTIDLRYSRPAKDDEICPFDVTNVDVEDITLSSLDVNKSTIRRCDEPDQPMFDVDDVNVFDIPDIHDIEDVDYKFSRRKRPEEYQPQAKKLMCIRFSVSSKSENKEYGMSVVEFGLESDVEVTKEDLDKLKAEDQNIDFYEVPSNRKGFVVFYLLKITSNITKFVFRLNDNFKGDVSTRQPSYVKVYDYYNPDKHCTKLYGTGPNRAASGVSYRCNKDNKHSQCLQSLCANAVDDEILTLISKNGRPAIKLVKYTCNPEKANYAVFVEIENITYVPEKEDIKAKGRILKQIHQGTQKLEAGGEMEFFWKMFCDPRLLEKGKQYYIIGKDDFYHGDLEEFRYRLMGTALVIKNLEENVVKSVMDLYTRMMGKGCQI